MSKLQVCPTCSLSYFVILMLFAFVHIVCACLVGRFLLFSKCVSLFRFTNFSCCLLLLFCVPVSSLSRFSHSPRCLLIHGPRASGSLAPEAIQKNGTNEKWETRNNKMPTPMIMRMPISMHMPMLYLSIHTLAHHATARHVMC